MDGGSAKTPQRPKRRSVRLRNYDYSQTGAYFVTICVSNRECLFGEIAGGAMLMNKYGLAAALSLEWLNNHYSYVELDEWIVMPNHIHAIILIDAPDAVGAAREPPVGGGVVRKETAKIKSLGGLVGVFKTISTRKINEMRGTPGQIIWQRNYYEHIIRSERELGRIRSYVYYNPQKWPSDPEKPENAGPHRKAGS